MSLRDNVFPIFGDDILRFLTLGAIKFCVIFTLTLTRDLKDTIIVTSCGAEAITFLKFFGVLPASFVFYFLYARFSSLVPRPALWYITAAPFFLYFVAFGFVIFPSRAFLHPQLQGEEGQLGSLYANWTFSLYYIIAELYSSVSVGILFWQFANDVVPMAKTPTFYPLFAQFSSLAPVVAGVYVKNFCANEGTDMETSMRRIAGAVGVCGLCMAALYRFYTTHLLEITPTKGGNSKPKGKPTKPEMSFAESARFLLRSEYLACIAVLVLSYGVAIQFSDIMWKSMVSRLYPEPLEYQRYFATFSSNVGVTTFLVIFVGSTLVKRVGWRAGALATPVTMGLLACPFFAMIVYSGQTIPKESLGLIVFFGALQGMLSKATKNAFFDPTVQMTYIPLDQESKVKGKAAIDVLGSRLGKSGCALLQQALVICFGTIQEAAPVVMAVFYAVIVGWLVACLRLSQLFDDAKKLAASKEE